jgi:two-component system LytT family response regulator
MMKLVIIEDERPALEKLKNAVRTYDHTITIAAELTGVKQAIAWLKKNPMPDLLLLDIELADGLSLEIFRQCTITCPVFSQLLMMNTCRKHLNTTVLTTF